ncbi:hypothetical protein DYB26_000500 [Aphanomyces astaci]|uniref:Uncharacterized protein n=2 Tax=Aphanomyces astaci TaxID=112090 RepID=A0A397F476_APHAT|nr:hypothetical protein DYB31_000200 [Aphanomyces astaci]RHZ19340.1 hypothetical protein DYB26_000500 [Aphanomyces astaci]
MQVAFPLSKATDSTSSLHTAENSTTPTPNSMIELDVTGLDNALSDWNNSATFVPTHVQIDTTVANPSNNQAMLIAIIACASLALFLVAFFVVLYVRRARRGSESNDRTRRGDDEGYLGTPPPSTFNRTSQHPRNQRQPPQLSPRQRQHLSKLSPRSFLHHSQPTPTSTSNASYMLPSPVNFILDHPGGNGVEYNNSFTRTAMANRSFAVDDIRDNNSAGSYQSDSAKGYFDLRLSTPAGSSGRSLSFSYRITSPEASMPLSSVSPRSVNSDLAMLDDDHRRSSGESSNFSIRVDSKEDLTADGNNDDLDGSSDHVTQLHDDGDRMKTAIDHQARRTSSVSSDLSSYHI